MTIEDSWSMSFESYNKYQKIDKSPRKWGIWLKFQFIIPSKT